MWKIFKKNKYRTNKEKTQLNNNGIVIGGTAGSTYRHVSPNLYYCASTVVCTDPKEEDDAAKK